MGWFMIFSGLVRTARNGRTAPMLRISANEAANIRIKRRNTWVLRLFDIWDQRRRRRGKIIEERELAVCNWQSAIEER